MVRLVLVYVLCNSKNQCCCTYCYNVALSETDAILVLQYLVHIERSCVAWGISEYVLQISALVSLHSYDTVLRVNAWVNSFYGGIDVCALHFSTYDIVAHVQWNDLLEVEAVLDNHNTSLLPGVLFFVQNFLFLSSSEFAYTQANGKLFLAVFALENKLLAIFVFCLIKRNETVAFRTSDSFHVLLCCWGRLEYRVILS